jgi:hypothetical protein
VSVNRPDERKETPSGRPATRPPPSGSAAVIIRFLVRLVILIVFASLGTAGFAKTFEAMAVLAACYCAIVAAFRREQPLGPVLTHVDEGMAYLLCACIASRLA